MRQGDRGKARANALLLQPPEEHQVGERMQARERR